MIDTIVNSFDIWTDAQGIKSRTRINSVDNISLEGIARLRELILDLAVSGKLVPQDPNEEPAFELLKKIELEKQLLIKEGKLSPQKKQLPISDEEKPFKISQSWEWVRLTDIGNIFNGNSIDATTKESKYTNNKGIPYIATKDVGYGWDILDYDNGISIPEDEINFKLAHKGSVLICAEGGSAGKKCGIANRDIYFGNKLFAIELFGNIPSNYILSNYLSSIFSRQFKSKLTGIIGGISIQKFNDIIIPLPPLSEQQRIVAKVNELMALCDKLEAEQFNNLKTHQVLVKTLLETLTKATDANELQSAWERMSANFDTLFCTEDSIDQLKQTILQLAVMGKLVKQDWNDEPASELLKKITKEKEKLVEEGKLKKTAPLAEISENEKTFLLPKGWEWKRLNDVIDVRDGTHDSPKEAFGDNTYPLITSQNFENGSINFDTAKRISEADHIEISKRSLVERFDILFSMIGGNLGNQVMVNTDRPFSVKNVALFKYYSKEHTSPYFIKKIMEFIALTLQSRAIGGAQPFVSLGFLRNIVIALPPIAEQKRIVEKINELFTLCEFLKEKIKKSQEIKILLSKTIVEKAVQ